MELGVGYHSELAYSRGRKSGVCGEVAAEIAGRAQSSGDPYVGYSRIPHVFDSPVIM